MWAQNFGNSRIKRFVAAFLGGVLLLFGGGLSLAAAVGSSELDSFIGNRVGALGWIPTILLVWPL